MSVTADAGSSGSVFETDGPRSCSVAGLSNPDDTTTRPPAMTVASSITACTSLLVPSSAVVASKVPSTTPLLTLITLGSAGSLEPPT